eukprot:g71862.t1
MTTWHTYGKRHERVFLCYRHYEQELEKVSRLMKKLLMRAPRWATTQATSKPKSCAVNETFIWTRQAAPSSMSTSYGFRLSICMDTRSLVFVLVSSSRSSNST